MTAIIRELPSGRGFKLSYMYKKKCETITFYHATLLWGRQFGILRDDKIMDPQNNLHSLLEIITVETYNRDEENELALFRTYKHVKKYIEQHSFVSNQSLIDKTRFATLSTSESIEISRKIRGVAALVLKDNFL